MVNYGPGPDQFSDVELADFGGTVSELSEAVKEGTQTRTSVFRARKFILKSHGERSPIYGVLASQSGSLTSSFVRVLIDC